MNGLNSSRKIPCVCIAAITIILSFAMIGSVAGDDTGLGRAEIDTATGGITYDVVDDESLPFSSSCDPSVYYKSIKSTASRDEFQKLLEATHRQTLPYTDKYKDDVWKALQDLDRGSDSNGSATVRLIYSKKDVPAEPKGTASTWNREHVWPKSRGVGYTGPDFTDVHHLFPADWGVNSIRNNRYFDICSSTAERVCKVPSELKDIQNPPLFGGDVFQPPPEVRGDIARAILYMDVRYPHLELTDSLDPEKSNQMAYLSTLLAWHVLDPPTEEERRRNDRACSRWQGNRNPFVDFPDLAKTIYRPSSTLYSGDGSNSTLINTNDLLPTAGDVMVVGVHSDNPDLVALVTLVDLPAGLVVHLTDRAYNGDSFSSSEGTMSLTLPETIRAGTVFGYGEELLYGSSWTSEVKKGFALSASGDTVIVYCTTTMESEDYTFLSAIAFARGKFLELKGESVEYGPTSSALPDSIADFAIVLENKDNYIYSGKRSASKSFLQYYFVDKTNWEGSDSKTNVSILPLVAKGVDGFSIIEPDSGS
uniref:Endonuclease I n=1 Tax=Pseudo-nitzschia australis TaxID=44445 RepID=A0A7S4ABY4_9STRA